MTSDYFNEFIKPLSDEMGKLLDSYEIPFSEISDQEPCTCCGQKVPFQQLIWSERNNPYCSMKCLDNSSEEFGTGYKPWIGERDV